jgi:hypothetical protein
MMLLSITVGLFKSFRLGEFGNLLAEQKSRFFCNLSAKHLVSFDIIDWYQYGIIYLWSRGIIYL